MIHKKLTDLNRRLIVSTISVCIIGILMSFSHHTAVQILLVLVMAGVVGVGVWEYGQIARAKSFDPALKAMILVAVCELFAFFAAHKKVVFSEMPSIVLIIGAIAFFLVHFKKQQEALAHIAIEFFGVCYIAVPLGFMLAIIYPISSSGQAWDGRWWLVYLIVVTKIADMGAYFIGRLWGKRKLAPVLSPKKTIEGAIAGFICSVLMSIVMGLLGSQWAPDLFSLPLLEAVSLGMCIGIIGQVGDLAESLLKRDASIKDSNTLPGLGGILDMVDSLLLTAPIVYFYLRIQG